MEPLSGRVRLTGECDPKRGGWVSASESTRAAVDLPLCGFLCSDSEPTLSMDERQFGGFPQDALQVNKQVAFGHTVSRGELERISCFLTPGGCHEILTGGSTGPRQQNVPVCTVAALPECRTHSGVPWLDSLGAGVVSLKPSQGLRLKPGSIPH